MADNVGDQIIGWKFKTPLKAEYLNKFMSGDVTPGLITRPPDTGVLITGGNDGEPKLGTMMIEPFMVAVNINEEKNTMPYDGMIRNSVVKINFTNTVTVNIQENHVAVGVEYTYQSGTSTGQNAETYAVVKGYTLEELHAAKDPVIIYTLWQGTTSGNSYIFATTRGATLSSMLLYREGWCHGYYVDIYSPYQAALDSKPEGALNFNWRTYKQNINRLVLRSVKNSNNNYSGFCSGSGISNNALVNPVKSSITYFNTNLLDPTDAQKFLLNAKESWSYDKDNNNNPKDYQLVCLVRNDTDVPELAIKGWVKVAEGQQESYPKKTSSELPLAVITFDSSMKNNFPLYQSVIQSVIPGPRASAWVEGGTIYLN